MEGGCLEYLGASTLASQPLDRILSQWLVNPPNTAMSPHPRHPSHWWNSGRKKNRGRGERGGGETLNKTAPQTIAQTLKEELTDPSSVQSYHIPCELALMGLTAGCPLSSWTAKLVNYLTAKLVNHVTAKLGNCLTAKLMNQLTAKLEVVNLVKLHLTEL